MVTSRQHKAQRAYRKRVRAPSSIDLTRVRERSKSNLVVRWWVYDPRQKVRVYPAQNKPLPPGPKKPRGPRIVSLEKFEEQRMREYIAIQLAKGKKI